VIVVAMPDTLGVETVLEGVLPLGVQPVALGDPMHAGVEAIMNRN
jgi:hypothetical protein